MGLGVPKGFLPVSAKPTDIGKVDATPSLFRREYMDRITVLRPRRVARRRNQSVPVRRARLERHRPVNVELPDDLML
jgi:hypothetical protein